MTNPMTPEEIEETKKLLSIASNDTLQSISMDLLAALEESQQQVNDLKEDKRKIFAVHDEQCARSSEYYNELIFVKGKLAEAQQTIANVKGILERPKLPIFNADGSFSWESHHKMMKKSLKVAIGVSEWEPVGNKEGSDKSCHR
ncbi:hypothetical protein MHH60_26245 [Paenibacillus sp. FSL H7-0716]|uniref:Uncharacterized protein n=1 Tax=Paenibacillus odorifer TaxID=189426 RepID=A0AB36J7F0_9BACL|nr:hypothetical protein [Paenibacillus odorifer]OME08883.1 hypothetical protein BSK47_32165 [Paenibacillus odorifer]